MPEPTEQPTKPQEGDTTAAATTASTDAPEGAASTPAESNADDKFAGLPDEFGWLKKGYEERGREAQGLRERLRDAEATAQNAKTPEEFAAVQQQLAEVQRALAVRDLAAEHGIPDDALVLLEDVPADQLEARAKALAAVVAKPAPKQEVVVTQVPLKGGATPSEEPAEKGGAEGYLEWRKSNSFI